jgi:hypothetical protein
MRQKRLVGGRLRCVLGESQGLSIRAQSCLVRAKREDQAGCGANRRDGRRSAMPVHRSRAIFSCTRRQDTHSQELLGVGRADAPDHLRTISERFAPQTLIRGSTGGGTYPRSVLWRSILRSASTIGVSTNIGLVAPAAPWKLPSLARYLSLTSTIFAI